MRLMEIPPGTSTARGLRAYGPLDTISVNGSTRPDKTGYWDKNLFIFSPLDILKMLVEIDVENLDRTKVSYCK
jgi:hypothetical protein